ncbi:DUF2461 domain-containing protein [Nocardioides iriomotensis]|uniref:DUF2461 domain-containing protein n=1 Tax=Nocardioides iriomotensis TaxID=715784 RepID=A0A4Q5IZR0_9ACTN|nr:DUF2461 domain-containing protein [Nocardioides iriomotensis]RYU10818.1 DUF2461 domain-containing protein [Nocardioides iriomotensis]
MTFTGFPVAALDFYDDLEMDNTKSFWAAHKETYDAAVKTPMTALVSALEEEFGPAKIFRPYRDVRFAKDKTPYKTHQGAYVAIAPATGWYVQVSAPGVRVGAGFYDADSTRLAAFRDGVADDRTGPELEKILKKLTRAGWEVGGETLKTSPRGYDAEHPRIELLRHKSLTVGRDYGFEPVIHTPELLDKVRKDWRAARPFVDWVAARLS